MLILTMRIFVFYGLPHPAQPVNNLRKFILLTLGGFEPPFHRVQSAGSFHSQVCPPETEPKLLACPHCRWVCGNPLFLEYRPPCDWSNGLYTVPGSNRLPRNLFKLSINTFCINYNVNIRPYFLMAKLFSIFFQKKFFKKSFPYPLFAISSTVTHIGRIPRWDSLKTFKGSAVSNSNHNTGRPSTIRLATNVARPPTFHPSSLASLMAASTGDSPASILPPGNPIRFPSPRSAALVVAATNPERWTTQKTAKGLVSSFNCLIGLFLFML